MNCKRFLFSGFAVVLFLASAAALAEDTTIDATSKSSPVAEGFNKSAPVLTIDFEDTIPMHNMSIASDGVYYYTSNGGSASSGQINTYDINGSFLSSVSCNLDMRGLFYNYADGNLYTKAYGYDLYMVDPVTGAHTLTLSGVFQNAQACAAITPDGLYLVEHWNGNVNIYNFSDGSLVNSMTGFFYGGGSAGNAVGTDGNRIFTWDGSLVHVCEMDGTFIESYTLPSGNYGFSLRFVNDLLFASVDGSGGTGHWYGYDVGTTALQRQSWGAIKGSFNQ